MLMCTLMYAACFHWLFSPTFSNVVLLVSCTHKKKKGGGGKGGGGGGGGEAVCIFREPFFLTPVGHMLSFVQICLVTLS